MGFGGSSPPVPGARPRLPDLDSRQLLSGTASSSLARTCGGGRAVGPDSEPTPSGQGEAQSGAGDGGGGRERPGHWELQGYFENGEVTALICGRACKTTLLGAIFQYDPISPERGHGGNRRRGRKSADEAWAKEREKVPRNVSPPSRAPVASARTASVQWVVRHLSR